MYENKDTKNYFYLYYQKNNNQKGIYSKVKKQFNKFLGSFMLIK